jgi:hypothetical protein
MPASSPNCDTLERRSGLGCSIHAADAAASRSARSRPNFSARPPPITTRSTSSRFTAEPIAVPSVSMAHMYVTGQVALPFFSFMTMLIAVPTGVKFFNWIGTMWRGSLTFETPMVWALGFLVTFLFGGLTGIILSASPLDFQLSDNYDVQRVVGHEQASTTLAIYTHVSEGLNECVLDALAAFRCSPRKTKTRKHARTTSRRTLTSRNEVVGDTGIEPVTPAV